MIMIMIMIIVVITIIIIIIIIIIMVIAIIMTHLRSYLVSLTLRFRYVVTLPCCFLVVCLLRILSPIAEPLRSMEECRESDALDCRRGDRGVSYAIVLPTATSNAR